MTVICITYNTKALFTRCYESVRKFHPFLNWIIVDGSDSSNPCHGYVKTLRSDLVHVYQPGYNIGHGPGLHYALEKCDTKTALLIDSDIVMLKSPLSDMLSMLTSETYGVGWVHFVGEDGFDYSDPSRKHTLKIPYLHPYFALLNVEQYFRFHKFVLHGAPCFKAMIDIYNKGLSGKILKQFPGLTGHTSGQGINWTGKPSEYVQHDFGGTRNNNKLNGQKEIHGKWEY